MNRNAYLDIARASLWPLYRYDERLRPGSTAVMSEAKYRLAMQVGGRPASGRHRDAALQLQQVPLRLETPGVAAERPVAGDDAVAGDHDRDRVVADRAGCGSVGLVVTGVVRDLRIGDQLAVWDARGHAEPLALEW